MTEFELVKLQSAVMRKWEECAGMEGVPHVAWARLAVQAVVEELEELKPNRLSEDYVG